MTNTSALEYWRELRASVTDKQIKNACRFAFFDHLEGGSCSIEHSIKHAVNRISDHFQCDRVRVQRLMDEVQQEVFK